jgi:hypothetical protein
LHHAILIEVTQGRDQPCEYGNKPSVSIKGEEFLGQLKQYYAPTV